MYDACERTDRACEFQGDTGALDIGAEQLLIVDDNEDLADIAAQLLAGEGFAPLIAHSAEEALDILDRHPQLRYVFTDVRMPGLSGVELALRIKAAYPSVRTVLTSAFASGIYNTGVLGFPYLEKPYQVSDVARLLRESAGAA